MSDLYIEARLQAIKDIASTSCSDIKDADNIAGFCDEIYSAIPKLDKIIEELELHSFELGTDTIPVHYVRLNEAIEIVKQEAEKYEECYKDCGDCEAYNKEKYHCPKFCEVIKETVKEIEENHNGWIPVEEELPKDCDNRFYMCIVENHEEDLPMFCQYDEEYGFGFWHDIYDEHTLGFVDSEFKTNEELGYEEVIAWQPLPQPYQPKGE